jgi:hypothetical protein
VDGQVRLCPFPLLPQPANSLAQADTNISCHSVMMAVFFGLHFAYRIQGVLVRGGIACLLSLLLIGASSIAKYAIWKLV